MRSTFKVLFYVNGSKEKNGIVPIMGRVTINGSVAQFSCKQSIHKDLWDVKGNRAKGKSKESRDINLALDNIKAQIIKHYQRISDREAFVTAEMVRNAYQVRIGKSSLVSRVRITCLQIQSTYFLLHILRSRQIGLIDFRCLPLKTCGHLYCWTHIMDDYGKFNIVHKI